MWLGASDLFSYPSAAMQPLYARGWIKMRGSRQFQRPDAVEQRAKVANVRTGGSGPVLKLHSARCFANVHDILNIRVVKDLSV